MDIDYKWLPYILMKGVKCNDKSRENAYRNRSAK